MKKVPMTFIKFDIQYFYLQAAGGKVLGGCATTAGWGRRFDDDMEGACKTDASSFSPAKIQ